ncbi:hypothetical protein [Paenibacillus thalictri]|uniref:Ureidoglycolate hydrolase n=1 Tax=Paenibacillus thalictri TaxID=2527873 RepID=A0A4Q9DR33_9BACL|nr:hypothetical protein [Paenibacillus thalictri]TBL79074.1 hypothetical protein EYB31_12690 [Paenibacillus thalictri]
MRELNIHKLKIRTTDDPLFETVARMAKPPQMTSEKSLFAPAYGSFNIADGTVVDLSYLYEPGSDTPWSKPRNRFDRHLFTEELWMVSEGDFYVPFGLCKNPDDPEDIPQPDEIHCFLIRKGDVFVLKPNVWHCGPWPREKGMAVSFYMALSGHRQSASGGNVDYIMKDFAGDWAILPDLDDSGRPL